MNKIIKQLVDFACNQQLICEEDRIYCINQLLALMQLDDYEDEEAEAYTDSSAEVLLEQLVQNAVDRGLISDSIQSRDAFDTQIMDVFIPKPSEVIRTFNQKYKENPIIATDWYYHLSKASNYIRQNRVAKDKHWVYASKYGDIDITINLSKPEKDPKDIAAAKLAINTHYPKCLLCKENVGFHGTATHPARHNHRIIPLTLDNQSYFMQYSPYVYYNEHCIVLNSEHIPMKIDEHTFRSLLDFVSSLPHYFIGSNADLPIVGGSILTHDHFQGGRYEFAMAKANVEQYHQSQKYKSVLFGKVNWPMSVIRARSQNKEELVSFAADVLNTWIEYSDESVDIIAYTDNTRHNTITPIARIKEGHYELDLVLRNNRTTQEYPMGIFHPHASKHHIKKENIGLIEVMGLAVLPSRLDLELEQIKESLLTNTDLPEHLNHHLDWFNQLKNQSFNHSTISSLIEQEVGRIFLAVLEDAGVYKQNEKGQAAFDRFVALFL